MERELYFSSDNGKVIIISPIAGMGKAFAILDWFRYKYKPYCYR